MYQKILRALPRQLIALFAIVFTLLPPAHADPGSRDASETRRTLSNIAYIQGNRAGLVATHAWTEDDVVYRIATCPLGSNDCPELGEVVTATLESWNQCSLRYGDLKCRIMQACEEDETAFRASDAGQASARGGLSISRCGAATDMLITRNPDTRHNIRLASAGTSRGGVDDNSARHVELWVLPPDVEPDFAGMGYREQMNDLQAAARLEALYSARNMPDANMFVAGFLLNLQSSKGPAWVTIPVNGIPIPGKGPVPDQCDLELTNPMSRSEMAAAVNGNVMPSGGEQAILTYVRERWVQIASCPTWVPKASGSDATEGGNTFIWDLSTGECRQPEHDEEGIITPDGVLELEIALRKEKQFRADSEGFARHLVAITSQDGFWMEGSFESMGYVRVHFDGLCAIDMHNKQVAARKAEQARLAQIEADRKAELAKIDSWYTKPVRLCVSFEGMAGSDILLTDPNPYSASAAFVGGGMVTAGGCFGDDRRRLAVKAVGVPQYHGDTEFYANAPAGLGAGGALSYQGGFRNDVGGEIAIGYYHSWTWWSDAGGDRWDSLDDTAYTQFLLRIHPRQDLLGYHEGRAVYRTGAHTGAFLLGVDTAVSFRSGMEPGSMMPLAQVKGVVGWAW